MLLHGKTCAPRAAMLLLAALAACALLPAHVAAQNGTSDFEAGQCIYNTNTTMCQVSKGKPVRQWCARPPATFAPGDSSLVTAFTLPHLANMCVPTHACDEFAQPTCMHGSSHAHTSDMQTQRRGSSSNRHFDPLPTRRTPCLAAAYILATFATPDANPYAAAILQQYASEFYCPYAPAATCGTTDAFCTYDATKVGCVHASPALHERVGVLHRSMRPANQTSRNDSALPNSHLYLQTPACQPDTAKLSALKAKSYLCSGSLMGYYAACKSVRSMSQCMGHAGVVRCAVFALHHSC